MQIDRRDFLKAAVGTLALRHLAPGLAAAPKATAAEDLALTPNAQVGSLYPLVRQIADHSTFELSYLHGRFRNLDAWKREARATVRGLLRYDPPPCDPKAAVLDRVDCGDFVRERITFNTTPDLRVPAFVLVPKGTRKRRPAIVALHDHGAFFPWGKEKIVATENEHPSLRQFKRAVYSGRSYASDLAARGYVVIAIDMFYWGERRMLRADDPPAWREPARMSAEDVSAFNQRSGAACPLVATALFEAGATWSGVMFMDDIRTVDYLASRPEVDPERIGCCGLSVGGFRSAHLAGLDPRIKSAVVVGWMSAYGRMLKSHLTSIGFMKVIPGLYRYLDLPDVVSMNAPGGLMVINGLNDGLFSLEGVHEAFDKIAKVYAKAGVPERFSGVTYDGPHEFNAAMQEKAFA
jgi:dienelactone hydrolase